MADKYRDPVSGEEIEYQSTCATITAMMEDGRLSPADAAQMALRSLGDKPVAEHERGSAEEWVTFLGKLLIIGGPKLLESVGKIIALVKLIA